MEIQNDFLILHINAIDYGVSPFVCLDSSLSIHAILLECLAMIIERRDMPERVEKRGCATHKPTDSVQESRWMLTRIVDSHSV